MKSPNSLIRFFGHYLCPKSFHSKLSSLHLRLCQELLSSMNHSPHHHSPAHLDQCCTSWCSVAVPFVSFLEQTTDICHFSVFIVFMLLPFLSYFSIVHFSLAITKFLLLISIVGSVYSHLITSHS